MGREHDDDISPEVDEGPDGESDRFPVVAEDIDKRAAEAAEIERARELRNHLREAEGDEVEEG